MKAKETYNESVTALHAWLQFLETKEVELNAQMERLRRKEDPVVVNEEPVETGAESTQDAWL
jgi:hypothetical protein